MKGARMYGGAQQHIMRKRKPKQQGIGESCRLMLSDAWSNLDIVLKKGELYAHEIDAVVKLMRLFLNYDKNSSLLCKIKKINVLCDVFKTIYNSDKIVLPKFQFLEQNDENDNYIYNQIFSTGNRITGRIIINNIFDLVIMELLEKVYDYLREDQKTLDSIESYLFKKLTQKLLEELIAKAFFKLIPTIVGGPVGLLFNNLVKYIIKDNLEDNKIINFFIKEAIIENLTTIKTNMTKEAWISHYMNIILKPTGKNRCKRSITYSLSETIATNIFNRSSITYGKLKKLVENQEISYMFDSIKVMAPIDNLEDTLDNQGIRDAIFFIGVTNGGEQMIRIKLFLTQLSIVFIKYLTNVTKDKIFKEYNIIDYDNYKEEEGSYCTVSG